MENLQEELSKAFAAHQMGRVSEAEQVYRGLIARDPSFVDAWQLLGALLIQTNRPEEAIACLTTAISHNPHSAGFWCNLAIAHARSGNVQKAMLAYQNAIAIDPQHHESFRNLSNLLIKEKRFDAAAEVLAKGIQSLPDAEDLRLNYGFSLHRMGKDAEAKPFFERHLEIEPQNKKALIGLGQILLKSTKPDPKGAECWERLVALEPNNPGMLNNLATTLKNLGRMPEAEDACRRALGIKPGYFPALCNLGLVLSSEARFDEARQTLREAIHQVELEGGELRSESYPELSKEQLIEFLSVTYNQLAAVTNVLGNEDEAQWAVDQGFRLVPDHSDHHMMQAFLYLQRGEFEKGWPHYEYRKENSLGPRSFSKPEWDGAIARDKTLLIHAEQGLGDSIHFIRYAKLAKERVGRVIFLSHRPLAKLMRLCPYLDTVVPDGDALPPFDMHIALLSMPHVFKTTFASVPRDVPYLYVDAELDAAWKEKLSSIEGLKIGIAWQGNKDFAHDQLRRVPLEKFRLLADIPGVRLICLQKGDGMEQLAGIDFEVLQFPDVDTQAGAFMDTAAIMNNLDLIISPCTATPHLAGALGRPVWLAKSFAAEWRWMSIDREDNAWYPTMKMFRQPQIGQWDPVFERMAGKLRELIATRSM